MYINIYIYITNLVTFVASFPRFTQSLFTLIIQFLFMCFYQSCHKYLCILWNKIVISMRLIWLDLLSISGLTLIWVVWWIQFDGSNDWQKMSNIWSFRLKCSRFWAAGSFKTFGSKFNLILIYASEHCPKKVKVFYELDVIITFEKSHCHCWPSSHFLAPWWRPS